MNILCTVYDHLIESFSPFFFLCFPFPVLYVSPLLPLSRALPLALSRSCKCSALLVGPAAAVGPTSDLHLESGTGTISCCVHRVFLYPGYAEIPRKTAPQGPWHRLHLDRVVLVPVLQVIDICHIDNPCASSVWSPTCVCVPWPRRGCRCTQLQFSPSGYDAARSSTLWVQMCCWPWCQLTQTRW